MSDFLNLPFKVSLPTLTEVALLFDELLTLLAVVVVGLANGDVFNRVGYFNLLTLFVFFISDMASI